jgi:hypothetical protein
MNKKSMTTTDALTELGLSGRPNSEEIKKAYHLMARKSHPDVGGSEETMKRINQAFEILSETSFTKFSAFKEKEDKSEEVAKALANELRKAMNPELFVKYFEEIFATTFSADVKISAKQGYNSFNAVLLAMFSSPDNETVFKFRGVVYTEELMNKATSLSAGVGLMGITEFPITVDVEIIHKNKKVKPYRRDYMGNTGSNLVLSPEDLFPREVMKRALKSSAKRIFSKQDMLGALRNKLDATFDGEYLTIQIGTTHRIVFYRGTMRRLSYWGCNGFYDQKSREKIIQGIMSMSESEETLEAIEKAVLAIRAAGPNEIEEVARREIINLREKSREQGERSS